MSDKTAIATKAAKGDVMEKVAIEGDLSKLTAEERTAYYLETCKSLGLNPYTKPFGYLTLNGKLVLYALKAATDQLRKINGVSVTAVREEMTEDGTVLTAWVDVKDRDGRTDTDKGSVVVGGLRGEALANAHMKALTKGKRRATLSICGLGWLDESELDTIPDAQPKAPPVEVKPAKHVPFKPIDVTKPTPGEELCDHARKRDAWLAGRKLIAAGMLLDEMDSFAAAHGFSDAPDEWNAEQVAAAKKHLSAWDASVASVGTSKPAPAPA